MYIIYSLKYGRLKHFLMCSANMMPTHRLLLTTLLLGLTLTDNILADDVTFYLYTRQNNETGIYLNSSNIDAVNPSNAVTFIVHGWIEYNTTYSLWYEPLKNALLDLEDLNVIEVDYSSIAFQLYPVSVALIDDVGDVIGDLIIEISTQLGISLDNFTVIGHSLGGQGAGFVGKSVINKTGSQIGKIVALDPAGPLFSNDSSYRLLPTDAQIVEVIHTDGGEWGYLGECGTVDFYPNGGTPLQRGCYDIISDIDAIMNDRITELIACSHHRSYWYYIEALKSGGFTGTLCSSWDDFQNGLCSSNKKLKINDDITLQDNGTYYLYTNKVSPYSIY